MIKETTSRFKNATKKPIKRPLAVLEKQIEKIRYDLYELAKTFELTASTVLAKSIELDNLLNQYHLMNNSRKNRRNNKKLKGFL